MIADKLVDVGLVLLNVVQTVALAWIAARYHTKLSDIVDQAATPHNTMGADNATTVGALPEHCTD